MLWINWRWIIKKSKLINMSKVSCYQIFDFYGRFIDIVLSVFRLIFPWRLTYFVNKVNLCMILINLGREIFYKYAKTWYSFVHWHILALWASACFQNTHVLTLDVHFLWIFCWLKITLGLCKLSLKHFWMNLWPIIWPICYVGGGVAYPR